MITADLLFRLFCLTPSILCLLFIHALLILLIGVHLRLKELNLDS